MVKIICPTLMQWESGIKIQITGYEGNPFDLRVQFNYVGDTRGKLEPVRQDFSCVIPDHYLTESRMLYIGVVNVNCCKHDTVGYVLKQIYRCAKPTGGSDGCSNHPSELLQGDWNQNNVDSLDYIKNKTHYIETEKVSKTYHFELDNSSGWVSGNDLEFVNLVAEKSETAVVTNGDETTGIGRYPINDRDGIYISYRISSSGRDVLIYLYIDEDGEFTGQYSIGEDTAGWWYFDIEFSYDIETVHQLDDKYISDNIARVEDIPESPITTITVSDGIIRPWQYETGLYHFVSEKNGCFVKGIDGSNSSPTEKNVTAIMLRDCIVNIGNITRGYLVQYNVLVTASVGAQAIYYVYNQTDDNWSTTKHPLLCGPAHYAEDFMNKTLRATGAYTYDLAMPVWSVNGQAGDVVVEQTQADWEQNDSTAKDYVKNRPFYSEVESVSETREFTDSLTDSEFIDLLVANKEIALYTVNGVSYVFSKALNPPVGYLWELMADDGATTNMQILNDVINLMGEVSISVISDVETVHHLDQKYIPDTIARTSILAQNIEEALLEAKESGEFDGTSVTIESINESTADSGSNVVTFSDGTTFTIKNGSKGSTGMTGADGNDGADGYTPVRGTDYWTADDIATIKSYVDDAILGGAW